MKYLFWGLSLLWLGLSILWGIETIRTTFGRPELALFVASVVGCSFFIHLSREQTNSR